ncbi:MAG: DUF2087 domain-containing protein [Armatimonadetes bacterium]|nr:DUF2087 domain-containing protein [Anaerolineae bacterium]
MTTLPVEDELLALLQAVADATRLALLRLLYQKEQSLSSLAQQLALTEPSVIQQLAPLRAVGLVTLHMADQQQHYRLNPSGLALFKQLVTQIEQTPPEPAAAEVADTAWLTTLGLDAAEQQILAEYAPNGRLTRLPTKQKKLIVILKWLRTLFELDKPYTEQEVNAILKAVYAPDYVGLRRDLVDFGYLRREASGAMYMACSY